MGSHHNTIPTGLDFRLSSAHPRIHSAASLVRSRREMRSPGIGALRKISKHTNSGRVPFDERSVLDLHRDPNRKFNAYRLHAIKIFILAARPRSSVVANRFWNIWHFQIESHWGRGATIGRHAQAVDLTRSKPHLHNQSVRANRNLMYQPANTRPGSQEARLTN